MKYIIMCGFRSDKPLRVIFGERIIERTIRLLRENGVEDIAISSNDERYEPFDVPVLHHDNPIDNFYWLNAFYPTDNPVCYIFGDVYFSSCAIRTIVETRTNDIMFFASAPPFSNMYNKSWAEPFAFKVQNVRRFFQCIEYTRQHDRYHEFNRMPISWELWQVIMNSPLNRIDYTNYVAINDYTVDVDDDSQAAWITDKGYR